jgi:hypothetical protein
MMPDPVNGSEHELPDIVVSRQQRTVLTPASGHHQNAMVFVDTNGINVNHDRTFYG